MRSVPTELQRWPAHRGFVSSAGGGDHRATAPRRRQRAAVAWARLRRAACAGPVLQTTWASAGPDGIPRRSARSTWLRWPSRVAAAVAAGRYAPARSRLELEKIGNNAVHRERGLDAVPCWAAWWLFVRRTRGRRTTCSRTCTPASRRRASRSRSSFGIRLRHAPVESAAAAPAYLPERGALHPALPRERRDSRRRREAGDGDGRRPFRLAPGLRDARCGVRTHNARRRGRSTSSPASSTPGPRRGHCIVPCEAIYEPDWRTGTHVPTRFTAANDEALGVAGLWAPWKDRPRESGPTATMLTINADTHPMFREMHRPTIGAAAARAGQAHGGDLPRPSTRPGWTHRRSARWIS